MKNSTAAASTRAKTSVKPSFKPVKSTLPHQATSNDVIAEKDTAKEIIVQPPNYNFDQVFNQSMYTMVRL